MMVFADTCAVDWPVPGRQDEQKWKFLIKFGRILIKMQKSAQPLLRRHFSAPRGSPREQKIDPR